MNGVEFRVLGPLEALQGGTSIGLGSRKQRRVLATLLAAPGLTRTTDQLIDDVWPDRPPRDPRASLHAYLSRLRRVLASVGSDGAIERHGESYRLHLPSSTVDADLFEQEVTRVRSEQLAIDDGLQVVARALGRWNGEAFIDVAELDHAASRAAHLRALRREARELQIDLLGRAGFDARAVATAEAIVASEPLDEGAHALVMLALYRAGRQADALRHFQSTRDLLIEELGVEPAGELVELEQRILNHDPLLLPASAVERSRVGREPAPTAGAELVGRSDELAALLDLVDHHDGHVRPVLVTGEPGIGKTRLLREVARRAEAAGQWLIWVQAERGSRGAALLPVAFAVAELAEGLTPDQFDEVVGSDPTALAPLLASGGLPAGGSEPIDVGDDLARYRMEEAVRRNLGRLAKLGPVLIVVDDFQWASSAMVELLLRLVMLREPGPVTFVIASRVRRSDGVPPGVRQLRRIDGSVEIELAGLDDDAVRQLAIDIVGDSGGNVAAEVRRRTGGNPLFVTELLRSLDSNDPVASLARPSAPASVAEAVLGHLDELPEDVIELLTVAALVGPTFEPALCAEIANRSGRAAELLEVALAEGLVVEASPASATRCTFRHDLVRTAISARLSAVRRSQLRARIGEALLARHLEQEARIGPAREWSTRRHAVAIVAEHLCAGAAFGTGLLGARHASEAAVIALDRHDAAEAARLARLGLEALIQAPATAEAAELEARLLCDRAEANQRLFQNEDSHASARRAFAVALDNGMTDVATRAIRIFYGQSAGAWIGFWSHSDETVEMVERLLERAGPIEAMDPTLAISLVGPYSEALLDLGQFERADRLTSSALALARRVGDPVLVADAADRRLAYVELTSDRRERVELCDEILTVSKIDHRFAPSARRHLIAHHLERGDLPAAEHEQQRIETLAERIGSDLVAFEGALCRTAIDLLLGRTDEAETQIAANRQRFGYFDSTRLDALDLQQLPLLWLQGALPFAEDVIRARLAFHDTHSWRAPLLVILVEANRLDEARAIVEAMRPAEFQRVFESALQFLTPVLLSEPVVALDDRQRATWLLAQLHPVRNRLVSFYGGIFYVGWVGLAVGRLLGVVGRFDEAQLRIDEAEQQARRLGSASETLRARIAGVELDARRGRHPIRATADLMAEADERGYVGLGNWCRRIERACQAGWST